MPLIWLKKLPHLLGRVPPANAVASLRASPVSLPKVKDRKPERGCFGWDSPGGRQLFTYTGRLRQSHYLLWVSPFPLVGLTRLLASTCSEAANPMSTSACSRHPRPLPSLGCHPNLGSMPAAAGAGGFSCDTLVQYHSSWTFSRRWFFLLFWVYFLFCNLFLFYFCFIFYVVVCCFFFF